MSRHNNSTKAALEAHGLERFTLRADIPVSLANDWREAKKRHGTGPKTLRALLDAEARLQELESIFVN